LGACRARGARLVIAKLDRLARHVPFISGLLESGVDVVAVDMPEANKLTIPRLAAVAEHECERIGQRTKAALAAARARGVSAARRRKTGCGVPVRFNSPAGCARSSRRFRRKGLPVCTGSLGR